jgi:hypothetical protein
MDPDPMRLLLAALLASAACLCAASEPDRIFADGVDGNDACIAPPGMTRLTSGVVTYTAGGGTRWRDLTSFSQIWGHNSASDAEVPWPGRQPSTPILTMPRYSYVAVKFTVPVDASPTYSGFIQRTTYSYGINMTAAYSARCGDFDVSAACFASSDSTSGPLPFPAWSLNPASTQCVLTPGATYYINVMATDPTMGWAGCPGNYATCPMGTNNLFGH